MGTFHSMKKIILFLLEADAALSAEVQSILSEKWCVPVGGHPLLAQHEPACLSLGAAAAGT